MRLKITLSLLLLILLSACETNPPKIVTSAVVIPAPRIEPMLRKAEACLARNQLTRPGANNARYWFEQVLAQDPANVQAKTGLQLIPLQYLQMARDGAGKGRLDSARAFVRRGLAIDPSHRQLLDFQQQLQIVSTQAISKQAPAQAKQDSVSLDVKRLAARSPEIIEELAAWANKAKVSHSLVIISSQSDGDGRWIYQQMRKAVLGYRLRADIQRGRPGLKLEAL